MPLNLPRRRSSNGQSGQDDFVSAFRFDARGDAWTSWDDTSKAVVDVSDYLATFDCPNTLTGWQRYAAGEAPDFVWDVEGRAQPRPSKDHRRGFSVYLWLDGFGLRELCANTSGLCEAFSILYDRYEADPRAAEGLLPIVVPGPSTQVDSPRGTYFEPSFEIIDWTPRPPGLRVRKPSTPPETPKAPRAAGPGTGLARVVQDIDDSIPF